jgi:hypothetical protein
MQMERAVRPVRKPGQLKAKYTPKTVAWRDRPARAFEDRSYVQRYGGNDRMKTSLKCHCGQRISRRDVMQQGYYMRTMGPSYVYIKYRCSRCKKLGEHFVKQEEWEDSLLHEVTSEISAPERDRFSKLGNITLDEMRDFHRALERLEAIPNLLEDEKGA